MKICGVIGPVSKRWIMNHYSTYPITQKAWKRGSVEETLFHPSRFRFFHSFITEGAFKYTYYRSPNSLNVPAIISCAIFAFSIRMCGNVSTEIYLS